MKIVVNKLQLAQTSPTILERNIMVHTSTSTNQRQRYTPVFRDCVLVVSCFLSSLMVSSSFVSAFVVSYPSLPQQQQQIHPSFTVTSTSSSPTTASCRHNHNRNYNKNFNNYVSFHWQLHEIIRADVWDAEPFDIGQGGVRLAMESAIKITGTIQHRPGKAESKPMELIRYRNVQSVPESTVTKVLHDVKAELICMGQGKEWYKDPGTTTIQEVVYAPHDAMRDALQGAGSVLQADRIVINVLGGDDLQLPEVLDALHFLVISLDVNTKAKIAFHSLSHSSIPKGTVSVTVVSFPHIPKGAGGGTTPSTDVTGEDGLPLTGLWPDVDKAIAKGEIYAIDGKWWTVVDPDINPALE